MKQKLKGKKERRKSCGFMPCLLLELKSATCLDPEGESGG